MRFLPSLWPWMLSLLVGCGGRSSLLPEVGPDWTPNDVVTPKTCEQRLWSEAFSAVVGPKATAIAVDEQCNAIVVGGFNEAVDFGTGPLTSTGGSDIFVVKFSPEGKTLWARQFGGQGDQQAVDVAVGEHGNLVIAGHYTGSLDLGGGLLAEDGENIFLAKLSADGEHIYSRRFGKPLSPIRITGLAVDETSGDAVLKGYFQGMIDLGGGTVMSAGLDDIFIAKYDAQGNIVFARHLGDGGYQNSEGGVVIDDHGDILMTGAFQGTVDFGQGPVTSHGDNDVYLIKLGPNGETLWTKTFGDVDFQEAGPIAVNSNGDVALAGTFDGVVDFGGGPMKSTQGYHFNLFIAQFDAEGDHLFSRGFGDVDGEEAIGLGFDPKDSLILAGNFAGALTLDDLQLETNGGWDIFAVRFNAQGDAVEGKQFGDKNSQRCVSATVDQFGYLLLTGGFDGQVDFGSGMLISTEGDPDTFVAKTAF